MPYRGWLAAVVIINCTPVERYFCGNCGSPIYSAIPGMEGIAILKNGSLDDASAFKPMFHAWCDSRQGWIELDDEVPQTAN